MLATITWDNLLSGIIGVFVGTILSSVIAWWTALTNTRDNLRAKLLALKVYHFADIGEAKDDSPKKFRDTYSDILTFVLAYRRLLPMLTRGKIDAALYYYRGDKKGELKNVPYVKYSHIDVTGELDFQTRIDKLLEAID